MLFSSFFYCVYIPDVSNCILKFFRCKYIYIHLTSSIPLPQLGNKVKEIIQEWISANIPFLPARTTVHNAEWKQNYISLLTTVFGAGFTPSTYNMPKKVGISLQSKLPLLLEFLEFYDFTTGNQLVTLMVAHVDEWFTNTQQF